MMNVSIKQINLVETRIHMTRLSKHLSLELTGLLSINLLKLKLKTCSFNMLSSARAVKEVTEGHMHIQVLTLCRFISVR